MAPLGCLGDPLQKPQLLGRQNQDVWWRPNRLATTWKSPAIEPHGAGLSFCIKTVLENVTARLILTIEQRSWEDEAHPKLAAGGLHHSPAGCGSATCLD